MNLLQAIFLGIIQGAAEFFPVSSSAHLKFARLLLGISENTDYLYFDLICHFGTWLALCFYLRKEIFSVLLDFQKIKEYSIALFPLIPAYFLLKPFKGYIEEQNLTGIFLIFTSLFLLVATKVPKKAYVAPYFDSSASKFGVKKNLNLETAVQDDKVMQDFELESLSMGGDHSQKVKAPPIESDYSSKDCFNLSSSIAVSRLNVLWIGCMQTLALLPGLSRSGLTIACAKILGWNWVEGARFSFLLAVPSILGGMVLESLKIQTMNQVDLSCYVGGFLASFIVGMGAVRFIFWFYQRENVWPFIWYCLAFGLIWIYYG